MPKYEHLIIYDWPDSQLCLECRNSIFLTPPENGEGYYIFPAVICKIGSQNNTGSECSDMDQLDEEEYKRYD